MRMEISEMKAVWDMMYQCLNCMNCIRVMLNIENIFRAVGVSKDSKSSGENSKNVHP